MTPNTNTDRQRAERVGRRLQMSGLLYNNSDSTVALIVRIIEQEMIPASGWIAVGERLPEDGATVLARGESYDANYQDGFILATFHKEWEHQWTIGKQQEWAIITHWQPLPAPPGATPSSESPSPRSQP